MCVIRFLDMRDIRVNEILYSVTDFSVDWVKGNCYLDWAESYSSFKNKHTFSFNNYKQKKLQQRKYRK